MWKRRDALAVWSAIEQGCEMSRKYFGTDGVRGAGWPITDNAGFRHASRLFGRQSVVSIRGNAAGERPAVLIGKDTRLSGYMLESALEAGFSAAGVEVCLVGPLPTPAVAYLTRALRLQAGIVISASHKPYYDNGIQVFSARGTKPTGRHGSGLSRRGSTGPWSVCHRLSWEGSSA